MLMGGFRNDSRAAHWRDRAGMRTARKPTLTRAGAPIGRRTLLLWSRNRPSRAREPPPRRLRISRSTICT